MTDADDPDHDADYLFRIVLQMFHPCMHASMVTGALGVEPKRSWNVGEARKTLTGKALEGTYPQTAWSISERVERRRDFYNATLEFVGRVLEPHADFLACFIKTGGRINLNVQLVGDTNIGDVLEPDHLATLSRLGIALGVEVFPDMN